MRASQRLGGALLSNPSITNQPAPRSASKPEACKRSLLLPEARTALARRDAIVAGGGVALLFATKALAKLKPVNDDQKVGIDIARRALQTPARQIAENAGVDGSIVIGQLLESNNANYGFDAQTSENVDMLRAGIIDPTKVVCLPLQDAASVAALLVNGGGESRRKKAAPAMPHGGGMGDMDF